MRKLIANLRNLKTESFILIAGNFILILLFVGLCFGFFVDMIDLPLAVLFAAPFVNLNFYLHVKNVDFCLTYQLKRSFGHYLLKILSIGVPVLISTILFAFDIKIFNPIVTMTAFIVFRLAFFFDLRREPRHV